MGSVPASSASHARSGHVSRACTRGRCRCATASWWRSITISASFHDSRRDNLISGMAWDTTRKISFKPTSRRSSHLQTAQDRPGRRRTLNRDGRVPSRICPGDKGFRHAQSTRAASLRAVYENEIIAGTTF
jgi:hypothetical protein